MAPINPQLLPLTSEERRDGYDTNYRAVIVTGVMIIEILILHDHRTIHLFGLLVIPPHNSACCSLLLWDPHEFAYPADIGGRLRVVIGWSDILLVKFGRDVAWNAHMYL